MKRLPVLFALLMHIPSAHAQQTTAPGAAASKRHVNQINTSAIAGAGTQGDDQTAFREFQSKARLGDPEAMMEVAQCYFDGRGTLKNPELGFKATLIAAKKGHPRAMYQAGVCYLDGIGTKRHTVDGMSWLTSACEDGDVHAARRLTLEHEQTYRRNGKQAEQLHKACARGAQLGDGYCQYMLGKCYEEGIGVEESRQEAYQWFEKSLQAGEPKSTIAVAKCLERGIGAQFNETKAFTLLRDAAKKGEPDAVYEFASMIERLLIDCDGNQLRNPLDLAAPGAEGNLREQYDRLMVENFETAAALGHSGSMNWLATRLSEGDPTEEDLVRAFELANESAKHGDVDGMVLAAGFHAAGIGTKPSETKAARLYGVAAKKGSATAQFLYGRCLTSGTGVRQNVAEGAQWIKKSADNGCTQASEFIANASRPRLPPGVPPLTARGVERLFQEVLDMSIQTSLETMDRENRELHERWMQNHGF